MAVSWDETYNGAEDGERPWVFDEIRKVWAEYDLERRTRFNTPVLSVTRMHPELTATPGSTRWLVNGVEDEIFDAVIVAVGTCGSPRREILPHADQFAGTVVHSSELDGEALRGKNVVVVGGGSSGIEAVETAVSHGAGDVHIVSREDRWIIPRNIVFDTLISLQRSTRGPISYLFELVVAIGHYRGAKDVLPLKRTIFDSTPVVNNTFIKSVRHGRARLVRGKAAAFTERGVLLDAEVPDVSEEHFVSCRQEIAADAAVIAAGYSRPSLQFLQTDLFPKKYTCPNLFLLTFCTEDWSLLLTNASYVDGIGTVGHFHIGIYTRLLLAFLRDPSIRPTRGEMKAWVNHAGGLDFITYMDMMSWLVRFHLTETRRLRWILFTFTGWSCSRVSTI
ncbi:FAD/NAD(P)-binding domain-containing protein [Exidia glandulosa HHB12029]|uniref:FAD/NAD(P)-binding domain-containing protein n=1 Tax=Exidia glandulosa HHB12029 TaxID=1314781 RepID=A0A165M6C1_EXIGL|nr:FAD/NAD(P)-binding domain-containing protein [Exidia glandulosa HHB12029]